MNWEPLASIASAVNSGRQSATELTKRALKRADDTKSYNAILRLNPQALATAEDIDARIKDGEKVGPLAGVPYLAKDNYLTKGLETTAASNILKGYIPPYDSTVVQLLNKAGAVLIGKTNLDAFAHGSSTENSDFGPTKNPYDETRVPGGSSGGSAAAVALGITPFALGTDTGGSIRQPASLCGVVGLKPTYGLVSRYGVIAMASSTDVMGPLTNSVTDMAYLIEIMSQKDWRDSTMIEREKGGYLELDKSINGLKIAIVDEFYASGVDVSVAKATLAAIDHFKAAGAKVDRISLPTVTSALAVYYVVVSAEISSNLSRYDGMRYGPRAKATTLETTYVDTRTEGFNNENRRRIIIGTYVLSSGYYEAYYAKAQKVRTLIMRDFNRAFDKYDILVGPTAPTTAFRLGEKDQDPLAMYMSDVLTVAPSLIGVPAISIPVGQDENNLPIGLQLIARQNQDRQLLSAASVLEGLL